MTIEQVNSSQVIRPLNEPISSGSSNGAPEAAPIRPLPVSTGTTSADTTNVAANAADNLVVNGGLNQTTQPEALSSEEVSKRLREAFEVANNFVQGNDSRLEFVLAGDPQRQVVRVVNSENNELIRQIPSEEFVAISDRIRSINDEFENVKGLLFNETI